LQIPIRDQGSNAFLFLGWKKNQSQDPGLGMNILNLIFENLDISFSFLGSKYSNSSLQMPDADPGIQDLLNPGYGMGKAWKSQIREKHPGSAINIPDPQRCLCISITFINLIFLLDQYWGN
jgi:hypothetical protein